MTKAEMKTIVNNAIKESKLNGHTWNFDGEKLTWSYLTVEYFRFEIKEEDEYTVVKVIYHMTHLDGEEHNFKTFIVGDDLCCDYYTLEEAIAEITKATIRKANSIF